jgi:PAS domain S-box-containing protein
VVVPRKRWSCETPAKCGGLLRIELAGARGAAILSEVMSDPLLHAVPEMHDRFMKVVEATTDVVAIADRVGRLMYLNNAGRQMFGWPLTEPLAGRMVHEIHPPWVYEVIRQEGLPGALREGRWSGETALLAEGGREVPVLQLILAHAGADGSVEFFSTICRDISERKHKDLERIEWANRYDAAIRASGQIFFDWDSQSGEISYGGDVRRLLGYSSDELAGGLEKLRQLVHADDVAEFNAEIERVTETRDPFHHEFRAIRKDGVPILIGAQGFFFLDRRGRIGRMVGFFKDVTEQRDNERAIHALNEKLEKRVAQRTAQFERTLAELEARTRQQEIVARLGQQALAGLSLENLMSEAAVQVREGLGADCTAVLEYLPDEGGFRVCSAVGWPDYEKPAVIPDGTESMSGYTLLSGEDVVSEDFDREARFKLSRNVRAAGARSGVSVSIQAGERPLGVLNAFFCKPREYAQDELSFMKAVANVITAALERQTAEQSVERARSEAEAANKAKSEFMSRMSHELRTPLNAILGFTQLLEMEKHDAKQAESIQHISQAGQNLLTLINEVLDIARLDAGRMQFHMETFELGEFLRGAVELNGGVAASRGIAVRFVESDTAYVRTDRERMKQIVMNLLSNAVKYNRKGGTVTVEVGPGRTDSWRVNVTDTGNGIAPEQIGRLFVPFERLGPRDAGADKGSGIGLALCQRLVNALGGRIGVRSIVGEGSTFWVEMPATAPPVREEPPTADPPPSPQRKMLLYIEDDVSNYYLLERILESRKDIKLFSALQGRLGLDLAREHRPNLILLDLNLPDMSGEQLLRTLKSDARTADIPVVAVTGEVASDRPDVLRKLGAQDVLMKPYRVQELMAILQRTMG